MNDQNIDLLAISRSSNMFYITGFTDEPGERLLMLLIPKDGDPVFLVPEIYVHQVKQSSSIKNIIPIKDSEEPVSKLEGALEKFEIEPERVAIDDTMWASFVLMLKEAVPGSVFCPASDVMAPLRRVKSSEEIKDMEKAGIIADRAFERVSELSFEGMEERQVARALEEEMLEGGGEEIAFETIVASGPNSALPHHRAGKRKIRAGDVVILDFGCRINGLCSDTSRTVICGQASKKQEEIYRIVKDAQENAYQAVRPGIEAQEVDRVAREYIAKNGFGKEFPNRTGHGIGLDVHEEPYIVEGNSLKLKEGMVFSVEPGIYIRGQYGMRVEDIAVVTEDGGKRLNNSTRNLKIT